MNKTLATYLAAAAISGPLLFAEKAPLELPKGFNPDTGMISHAVDGVVFHQPRASVWAAERLLANGAAQDVALADRMLRGVLTGLIRDPKHPHYGAYKWELEMEQVEDLNARN